MGRPRTPFIIPARVKIGNRWWRVERGLDLVGLGKLPGHADEPSEGYAGVMDAGQRVIQLDGAFLGKREECVTLLHEVLHAVTPDGIVNRAEEERLFSAIEHPLLAALERLQWRGHS